MYMYVYTLHSVHTVYSIVSALKTQRSRTSTSMNTTGANWRLWSKRQLHSQRFANFLHCHALVNLIGAWTLVFWYMLVIGLCNVSIISYIVLFWHLTVENSTFPYFLILAVSHARCQSYRRHLAIISAPSLFPRNHIGATFRFATKCISPNCRMYLSKLKNVFVKVCPPAIISAPPSDLLQKVTLTKNFDISQKSFDGGAFVHWSPLLYSEESVKSQKLDIFPWKHLRLHLFFYFHLHSSFSFLRGALHVGWNILPLELSKHRAYIPPEGTLHNCI